MAFPKGPWSPPCFGSQSHWHQTDQTPETTQTKPLSAFRTRALSKVLKASISCSFLSASWTTLHGGSGKELHSIWNHAFTFTSTNHCSWPELSGSMIDSVSWPAAKHPTVGTGVIKGWKDSHWCKALHCGKTHSADNGKSPTSPTTLYIYNNLQVLFCLFQLNGDVQASHSWHVRMAHHFSGASLVLPVLAELQKGFLGEGCRRSVVERWIASASNKSTHPLVGTILAK